MWIYWVEQCKYCKNQNDCSYETKTNFFINQLKQLEQNTKGVYGTLNFKCDYFLMDDEKYMKLNIGENNNGSN